MKRRKMKVFPTVTKALTIHDAKNCPDSVKKSRLIWKRDDKYAAIIKRGRELFEDIKRVHKMLQDFQTKYGITSDELKRLI